MTAQREVLDDITKAPRAELWYGFDFGVLGWLPTDEVISEAVDASPEWTVVEESGAEETATLLVDDDHVEDGAKAMVRLTGGTVGLDYIVTALITTTPNGDVDERSLRIRCRER